MALPLSRRQFLLGGLALGGSAALAACGRPDTTPVSSRSTPTTSSLSDAKAAKQLSAEPISLDIGGIEAKTWGYSLEGGSPAIDITAGDTLRVEVTNNLPESTSVHWHGLAVPNDMDGVPGMTQDPIEPGSSFTYEFQVNQPGTYFYHSHSGIQLDKGLHAPLIVRDPNDPGDYDVEWTILLDDWMDGVDGQTPEAELKMLQSMGSMSSMSAMGSDMMMSHGSGDYMLGGDTGDVSYPYYLLNQRIPSACRTFTAKPGQKAKLRFINAAADTIFKIALGGHTLTLTHTDGYAVEPTEVSSFYLAMGERADAIVTLDDGAFPLAAIAAGKDDRAFAVVRTGSGEAPSATTTFDELATAGTFLIDLRPAESSLLDVGTISRTSDIELTGQMMPYEWGITVDGESGPVTAAQGQNLRMTIHNATAMAHPMHLHGHTWSLPDSGGLRKDTILVLPGESVNADLVANNPGEWAFHCHNGYHMSNGMMTSLQY